MGQLDRELAASAIRKRQAGLKPTREENAALRRVEKAREEADRQRYYQSIPAKHWVAMSGRSHQVLKDQAQRYGIPIGGPTIDLYDVAAWLHRAVADGRVLPPGGAELDMFGGDSPAKERWQLARAELAELELAERKAAKLDREITLASLALFFRVLRQTGESLGRLFGPKAVEVFDDGVNDAERGALDYLAGLADRTQTEAVNDLPDEGS